MQENSDFFAIFRLEDGCAYGLEVRGGRYPNDIRDNKQTKQGISTHRCVNV